MTDVPQAFDVGTRVLAVGSVDATGVVGSCGVDRRWRDMGLDHPADRRAFRAAFDRGDPTFRRLDHVSRALVLAAEAAGLSELLPLELAEETAIVIETQRGALDTDARFADSLDDEEVAAPLFPYTLTSTSLGEVALRHDIRGVSLCLSTTAPTSGEEATEGAALREAVALLDDRECPAAVVGVIEVLERTIESTTPAFRATVALLARADVLPGLNSVVALPASSAHDPYGLLRASQD